LSPPEPLPQTDTSVEMRYERRLLLKAGIAVLVVTIIVVLRQLYLS
jgi:hypothetical protein